MNKSATNPFPVRSYYFSFLLLNGLAQTFSRNTTVIQSQHKTSFANCSCSQNKEQFILEIHFDCYVQMYKNTQQQKRKKKIFLNLRKLHMHMALTSV